ncbi:hypothetical protein TCAL_14873 [Tigriopus californicus]|uniref:Major facilitator superfamily (MFS) profile domain-containing protein n=1 Tax=Tigriopus californicus TaxID=6832 RepID=A0A553P1Y2_TIGCA|nr:lysosomal proton-coupled steroid conjugate and bile acid symporter SLC46A3-like [Tigriopus californicus]TRY71632.1 hypothetical protein TCAL_14873 [Tigriopus californicus]
MKEVPTVTLETPKKSIGGHVKSFFQNITVEPAYLIFAISQGLYMIVASELYITKVCKVNLAFSEDVCDNIQQHKEEQVQVQKYVSTLKIYNSILQAFPSVLFALFAGPWSDTHGRKFLIMASMFGFVFNNGVFMINAYFFYQLKAEYLLFECLQDCTGGFVVFFMSVNAYLADVTSPETRTKRVAFMSGLWPVGFNIGKALSGVIKTKLGFMFNFGIGMALSILAMLYILIFLKDSIAIRERRLSKRSRLAMGPDAIEVDVETRVKITKKQMFTSLFDINNVKRGFRALTKKRKGNLRTIVILMVFCFEMEMFINVGEWSNTYLFLRRQLEFTMVDYTRFSVIVGIIGISAQYITIPLFTQKFKFRDSTIVLIDIAGCFIQTLIVAFASSEWMLYLGACIAFLDATSFTMLRCMISKYVEPDEFGTILSIIGAIQSFIPIASSPIFGILYRSTVELFPQLYLLVLAALFLIDWGVLLYIHVGLKKLSGDQEIEMKDMEKEGVVEKLFVEELPMEKGKDKIPSL